jgi:Zn-dependent peptidase ImmA (M78 family)
LASKTFRLYSIVLKPVNLKRRATTRYHHSGAIIYYNSSYEEKTVRILIAHEVGHIVNKELLENAVDSEQTANLFAYIAMLDKNKFYMEECKKFISNSDIQIFNDIVNIYPV